jgi:DNA-binding NarL/FixJ family response regulator
MNMLDMAGATHTPASAVAERADARVLVAAPSMQHPPEDAPDVLVIDLARCLETDPLRLCRETARRSPATAIIGIGPEERLADGFQLLRLGALSWATVDGADAPACRAAITSTLDGESVLSARHAAWLLADFATLSQAGEGPDPRHNLTATEREVLTRLAKGQSAEEVAAFHDVEPHLVRRHVRFALRRLQRHR